MSSESHPDDLIGAYVVDACTDQEAAVVVAHADHCPACAGTVDRLTTIVGSLGELTARRPARELRSRVLTSALSARPACDVEISQVLAPYVVQVAAFDRLLDGLPGVRWQQPVGPHASVVELVGHLRANDALALAGAGRSQSESTVDVRRAWRDQAEALVRTLAEDDRAALDRPVRLAGRGVVHQPLREMLTQRVFETWIHADDLRQLLALPPEPPAPAQLNRIADFGLRLLPGALDAAGKGRPYQLIRLTLTGPGGGERLTALSATTPTTGSTVVAEIAIPTEHFCRLLAGRLAADRVGVDITGDAAAARDLLTVAATMGCD